MKSNSSYYQSSVVKNLREYYGDLLTQHRRFRTISAHLQAIADHMWSGLTTHEDCIYAEISNYHPKYLGKSKHFLAKASLTKSDCQQTIASEYGYQNWEQVLEKADIPYNHYFEDAVNLILSGDLAKASEHITKYPSLVHIRSRYGHRASLLHYLGSNGVEMWRQIVPKNLPEMIEMLLAAGADKSATMPVYGGEFTTLQLLETSAHPEASGLKQGAIERLNRF